jgi:signal transduction histidine kinase
MTLSARARETLALVAVVLLVAAVLTVAHLTTVAEVTWRAAGDEARLLARQLFHQTAHALRAAPAAAPDAWRRDPGLRAVLDGMVGYSHVVVYAAVVDPAGRALVHSDPARQGTTLAPQRPADALHAAEALARLVTLLGEPAIYEAGLPLVLGDQPFGTVRVGLSTSLVRRELVAALRRSLAVGAVAVLVALAVGLGAGRALLQVGRRIVRRVGRLARGEWGEDAGLARGDTLGALAAEVNRLGERIQADPGPGAGPAAAAGALDTLEDGVLVLDEHRAVAFANRAAERLLDRPAGALAGRPLSAVLPSGHPLLALEADLFADGGPARNRPLTLGGPGGDPREAAVSGHRLPAAGGPGGAVLVLRDLGPVRAVESLVGYAQKLAALGRLTSGVAHEVKNPLNAMRIHLELLRVRLPDPPPGVVESLEVIAEEIQRLDRVVQGFLRFMRPQDVTLAPVELGPLVADVARVVEAEAGRAGVRTVLEIAPGLPPVTADAELLRQALQNLVANAIQAMPRGGTLTLATGRPSPGEVSVCVRDEGVGIPPEDVERIFRLYYTTKPQGSGLGLALVYRIVQLHDGRIDVDSTVGRGTAMTVTLPLRRERAAA